jgi:hypothetical protein
MAITAHMYGQFLNALATKTVKLDTDALKVMLATATYTPNQATDAFQSVIGANEISGTGYTAGGMALTGISLSDTANVLTLSAANTPWPGATFTARYAIIVDTQPGSAATNPLIGYIDFGANQSPSGVTFQINWTSGQVLQITAT